jgi:carbonic anhydrase
MARVFDDVLSGAEAYAETFELGDLTALPTRRLAVLTCMDTRIDPLRIFGLQVGEAAILRNAGARIDDGMRRAIVMARDALGIDRLLVLGHRDCRGTDDAFVTVAADVATFDVPGVAVGGYVYDVATGRVTPA